jgi:sugar transferase (PEP-CTERM system associated)
MIRLFRVFVPVGSLALLVSEILLVSSAFILATYIVMEVDPTIFLLYDGGLGRILLAIASIVFGLYLQDLYSDIRIKSRTLLVQQLCLVFGAALLIQGLISYLNINLRVPIRVMMLGSFLSMPGILLWRMVFSSYALKVVGSERLLLVGASPLLEDIGKHIEEHPEMGLQVVGFVNDNPEGAVPLHSGKMLGDLEELTGIVRATRPDRIIVGLSERRNRVPMSELLELRFAGFIIEEAATAYEKVCGRICLKELRPAQLIYSGELEPQRQSLLYQNLTNMTLAVFGLLVSLPVMLLTAIAVRLSSAGPVLYQQTRVGLNGSTFTLYKFRSMKVNAEAATGAVWASRDDPRVTRVGRIIRSLRIDETPQLINVLKREMSIVGPRPERPEFVHALSGKIPYYRQRLCVRPGITGWAQINYKYGDTLEDTMRKLEYDLYYIKHISPSLDMYIIFNTIKAMLLSRGAQ